MHYPAIEVDEKIESQCKSEILTEKWNKEYENQKETQDRKFIQALQKEDLHQNERKEERQYLRCVQEKSCKKTRSTCHSILIDLMAGARNDFKSFCFLPPFPNDRNTFLC